MSSAFYPTLLSPTEARERRRKGEGGGVMNARNRKAVISRDGRSLEFIHKGKWVRLPLGFSIWGRLDETEPMTEAQSIHKRVLALSERIL